MKPIEEFKKFYDSQLMPDLIVMETDRKKTVRKILITLVPVAIITLLLIPLLQMFAVVLGGIICVGIFVFITKGYVSDFKQKVISKIVHFIDKNLTYIPEDYISHGEFALSDIFLRHADSFKGDDRVYGKIGATKINFSECVAKYRTKDSKGRTQYTTFFKGLFFIADFNKHFKGKTIVLPDTAEKLFGSIGSFLQKRNMARPELIKLEDPEFEKHFVVYADDQIEARYILSTSLMRRITDYKKKTNKKIHLSFVASKVFVAVSYKKNLLEPRVFRTMLDFNVIKEYYEDLQLAISIVEELNLNTRIWSKQ